MNSPHQAVHKAIAKLEFGAGSRLPMIHQTELAECGLACLAMVSGYHGAHLDLPTLRQRFAVSLKGLPLAGMVRAANAIHLSARPLRLELEGLKALKLPCVLHWNFNHYVVLKQVRKDRLVIHDPAYGVRTVSLEEASKSFTGFAIELWPSPGFSASKSTRRLKLSTVLGQLNGWAKPALHVLTLALVLEVAALLSPLLMQMVIDEVLPGNDRDLLLLLTLGFAILYLAQEAIQVMRASVLIHASAVFSLQVRANLFQHLLRLPIGFFLRRSLGDVASRFSSVDTIQRTVTSAFIEAILDGLMASATLVLMLVYSPKLAAISLVALAIYITGRIFLYRPLHTATEAQIVSASRQNSHLLESIRGVRAIKLFGRAERRHAAWLSLLVRQMNADLKTQYIHMFYSATNSVIFVVENLLIVYFGALAVLDGQLTAGVLLAFMTYKSHFGGRVTSLVNKFFDLQMLNLQLDRVSDFVVDDAEIEPLTPAAVHEAQPAAKTLEPGVEIRGLSFRYGEHEKEVLSDIHLSVAPGEFVAISGPSGCGKSTLLQLILGVFPANKGSVTIGGVEVSPGSMNRLRGTIGTVMQDDDLFAGTILDNICFFDDDADRDWAIECAKMVAIHEDIEAMPMAYHTFIGDMGSVLSGGQKQRVLLARALYKRPGLLLLDEATSHLDIQREKEVNAAIGALRITRIIVAHRPDTLASADRVIPFASLSGAAATAAPTPASAAQAMPA